MSAILVLKFSKYPLLLRYIVPFCKMEYINIDV